MKPQSLAMITKLVGFDTVSRNSNLELIHYVKDYLAEHGVDSHLVASPKGDKANLFATVSKAASCCRVIRMLCRWMVSLGTPTHSRSCKKTGNYTDAAPAT